MSNWIRVGRLWPTTRGKTGFQGSISLGIFGEISIRAYPDEHGENPNVLNIVISRESMAIQPRRRTGDGGSESAGYVPRDNHAVRKDPECPVGKRVGNHPTSAPGCTCIGRPGADGSFPDSGGDDDIPF